MVKRYLQLVFYRCFFAPYFYNELQVYYMINFGIVAKHQENKKTGL